MQRHIDIEEALNLKNKVFVDVRSNGEYMEDHIIGSINIPILENEERKKVGTIYKQVSKDEAIRIGIDVVSPKLNLLYEKFKKLKQEDKEIVVYCAKGGMRSSALVSFLNSLGLSVYKLNGGYKSYRNFVINFLQEIKNKYRFVVLHGLTGVGKTIILNELEKINLDVVDLEEMAKNSGSVFGHVYFEENPPTQRFFESQIFSKLFFSKNKDIFIESESKRIGSVIMPESIYNLMQETSLHILVQTSLNNRVDILVQQYIKTNNKNDDSIKLSIENLRKRLGNDKVNDLLDKLLEKNYTYITEKLILDYYDPLYQYSIDKYKYDFIVDYKIIEDGIDDIVKFYERECM